MAKSRSFTFDGGALTYWGTLLLAFLLTVVTLGLAYPFALILRVKWRTKHTKVNGVPLVFDGTALGLIGRWIIWWLLMIVTIGIYAFWVAPQLNKWIVEHTDFNSRAPLPPSISINGTTYVPLELSTNASQQLNSTIPQVQLIESIPNDPNLPIEESSGGESLP